MRYLSIIVVLLAACSSSPEATAPSPSASPSPEIVVMTAGEYWDQNPAAYRKQCRSLTVFTDFIGRFDDYAYKLFFADFRKEYVRAEDMPLAKDAFAELVIRCDL